MSFCEFSLKKNILELDSHCISTSLKIKLNIITVIMMTSDLTNNI